MTVNRYDRTDIVRQNAVMRAGPLKIAAYQVRDPETQEFSKVQFHMTYDNIVMAMLDESSAKLFAGFITDFQEKMDKPLVVTDRIKELLESNTAKLEENRALHKILKEAGQAAGQNDIGRIRELLGAYA